MELKNVDLNLLLVFQQILKEKRVSTVAETLNMTQPGVSNALKRLRTLLNDELFLRTARGMEPTPYALRLAGPIGSALSTIQQSLNEVLTFDPASSTKTFTIGLMDNDEAYFLPALMHRLSELAPQVCVNAIRNIDVNLQEEMEAGRVDLAIGALPQLQTGFFQRRLFRQPYVCMFRKGHPLAGKKKITKNDFASADHVIVASSDTGHGIANQSIARNGVKRKARLTVPHFITVGHILATSDLIATVPELYARECADPFGLTYVKHPLPLPDTNINVLWHTKFHREPDNQWLRTVIHETFSH